MTLKCDKCGRTFNTPKTRHYNLGKLCSGLLREIRTLNISCHRCKRSLGKYEGEDFTVQPAASHMEILCNQCLGRNKK